MDVLHVTRMKRERGASLLLALVMLAVGALILVPLLSFMASGLKITGQVENNVANTYAADAGIERGIFYLTSVERPTFDDGGTPQIPLSPITQDDGTVVNVILNAVAGQTGVYKLTSTSTSPAGIIRTIVAFVELAGTGGVFDNAIISLDGDVYMSGSAKVIGDIYCGGSLVMDGSSIINGNAYSDDAINLAWSVTISGDAFTPEEIVSPNPNPAIGGLYPGAPTQEPATLTDDEIDGIVADTLAETNFTHISAGPATDTNLTFSYYPAPSSTYTSAIHATGNMNISTGTSITFKQAVFIDGDLTINSSNCTFIFEGPVVVGGKVNLQNGNAVFKSSLWVGNDLVRGGSATASFESAVRIGRDLNLGSGGGVTFGGTIYVGRDFLCSGASSIYISDDIYVGRNLTLSGSSYIVGGQTVVVLGDVDLSGATKITDAGQLPFILAPNGDFDISGSGYASAVVYAPEADVSISGAAKLYGAVISNSITLTGSASVEYAAGLDGRDDLPGSSGGGAVSILTWDIR
ncbi:type IV fimbrial biogenesis protein PilX [Dehalogenimonas sp. WBC-2]|nr:type IV fimbrial biogenesis protein PilX [Dehalogenimonas sp. WBC-2]